MRVIAGTLGGRQFDSPGTFKTHPMSDKARGALFNILGDIEGLTFLDAFGGSGALAFEAVSRGAAHVTVLEQDLAAQKTIERNIRALDVNGHIRLIKASGGAWLRTSEDVFNVVMCDPPYGDLQPNLIRRLAMRAQQGGLLVLSWPADGEAPVLNDDFTLAARRPHGDMQLLFFRRIAAV